MHATVFESAAEREQSGRQTDSAWMRQAAAKGLPVCHLGGIMGYASLADGVDRAQAGLEPGFEDMYSGLDAQGFAANMAMRDDIASASVVGGRRAGHQALAKYRTPTGSVRPNEKALQEARQQQRSGPLRLTGSLPAAPSAASTGRPSPGLSRPRKQALRELVVLLRGTRCSQWFRIAQQPLRKQRRDQSRFGRWWALNQCVRERSVSDACGGIDPSAGSTRNRPRLG